MKPLVAVFVFIFYLLAGFLPVANAADVATQSAEHLSEPEFDDDAARAAFSSGDYQYCALKAKGEYQLKVCLYKQAEYAERKLNETYKHVMAQLSSARQKALRQEERSWIRERKAECARQVKDVEDCVNGCGVPWTMEVVCMTKEADERSQQLISKWQQ